MRPYEKIIVDAVIGNFSENIQRLLRSQLKQKYFVERSNERINVFRFYGANNRLSIQDPNFDDMLINVQIDVDGKVQTAHVTFYKGYVFSIEFKKPGSFYVGKKINVRDIQTGNPDQAYTIGINRIEHGKE